MIETITRTRSVTESAKQWRNRFKIALRAGYWLEINGQQRGDGDEFMGTETYPSADVAEQKGIEAEEAFRKSADECLGAGIASIKWMRAEPEA